MASFERKFTLQVQSSTENLSMIRDFIGKIGDRAGMDEREIGMLELAVDEACSNVMEHSYGEDPTKDVTIRAMFDNATLQIGVIDTGLGFNPAAVEQKELQQLVAEHRSGGLGMRIMKKLMDEIRYENVPGVKNELWMVKKLKNEKAGL